MSSADVVRILNQLLVMHSRSLPVYLADARPWVGPHDQAAAEIMLEIAEAHRDTQDRLAEMVIARGGIPAEGEFPLAFTGYNDLSMQFLADKAIGRGKQAIATMNNLADQLGEDSLAQAVCQELTGEAKGHVESLEEVRGGGRPALKVAATDD